MVIDRLRLLQTIFFKIEEEDQIISPFNLKKQKHNEHGEELESADKKEIKRQQAPAAKSLKT
jgi:hypothetical protein